MSRILIHATAALFALAQASSAEVVVVGPAYPTHGNDTASTLYLRPLNNAMLGTAYFGSGYPRSVTYAAPAPEAASGTMKAMGYLQNSGWSSWQMEKQALLARIADLERKIAELERKLESKEK